MLNSIYEKMIFVGDRINKKSFRDIVIFDKKVIVQFLQTRESLIRF